VNESRVWLDDELTKRLDELGEQHDLTRSAIVSCLVMGAIKRGVADRYVLDFAKELDKSKTKARGRKRVPWEYVNGLWKYGEFTLYFRGEPQAVNKKDRSADWGWWLYGPNVHIKLSGRRTQAMDQAEPYVKGEAVETP